VRTVDAITAAGGTAVAHQFDASDEGSVTALMQRAVDEFGGLDGVHANAMDMSRETLGIDGETDLCTIPLDVWQRTLDVGLTGFLLVARHAIPRMLERGGGGIVGTASGAIYAGEPMRVGYATAKTGMTAIIRHIASRWGREGIRANVVAPGIVPADGAESTLDQAALDRMMRLGRSHRIGRPSDIAGMVTFLLSDDGSWVNAQVLSVDGGTMLGR
jgi:NAD(P)-dependent dehydrogenase (short-subunit alcohol dehydrogenase family)